MLLRPPGVYRAESDTEVLIDALARGGFTAGRSTLDLGTGSGAVALAAARLGASSVTAVDLSRRSVAATRCNAALRRRVLGGVRVEVLRGDLYGPVAGRRFDLVVANPPYVPAPTTRLPRHRKARCWDAGPDGRAVLDRICAGAADHLTGDGRIVLVHSALAGTQRTVDALGAAGFASSVLARATIPFGPVLRSRAAWLESRGLVAPGYRFEELVVIGGVR